MLKERTFIANIFAWFRLILQICHMKETLDFFIVKV